MEASSVTNALYEQLNFRGEKQKVISSNIANINTPNYKTKDLIFEDELKSADNSLKCKEVYVRYYYVRGCFFEYKQYRMDRKTGLPYRPACTS